MPYQGSPGIGTRSPAMMNATPGTPQMNTMHMMPGMQGQPNGYFMGPHQVKNHPFSSPREAARGPPTRGPNRGRGTRPGRGGLDDGWSSKDPALDDHHCPDLASPLPPSVLFPYPDLSPESGYFERFLTQKAQGFGIPTQADPSIQIMYNQQYYGTPAMQAQYPSYMPPQSPRPPFQQGGYTTHMQPTYSNQGQPPTSMSRQSSQMSAPDRPGSSIGQQSHTPAINTPAPSHPTARTPSISTQKPNYTIPAKKSAAVTIKNSAGEVISFKPPASPANPTPVVATAASTPSAPTPPSRTGSAADNTRTRTDSVGVKSEEEKKRAMQEAVAKKIAEDEAKLKREKEEAEQKAQMDKEAAEAAEREVAEAKARAEALEKERQEAEAREAEAREAEAREAEARKAEARKAEAQKAEEKAKTEAESKQEPTAAAVKADEEEIDFDAIEAEFAAKEAEEARLEEEYRKKKAAEKEAQRKKEEEETAAYEANMKEMERKAEEEELAREKDRTTGGPGDEAAKRMFAELKAGAAGTPASVESPAATPVESGTATPVSDVSMPPPARGVGTGTGKRGKAAELTLDTKKPVEPPEPSATLKALQSAKKLEDLSKVTYPPDVASPNPALNANAPADRRFKYDKEFLLQFQSVFKEKPSLDWDARIRDALGDGDSSARPSTARTPSGMGARSASARGPPVPNTFGPMGAFGGARPPLPPGTTSEQRFAASNAAMRSGGAMTGNPFAQFGRPGQMAPAMGRTPSNNPLGAIPGSPRVGGASRGGSRAESKRSKQSSKMVAEENKSMPLTAGMSIGALEVSATGWKPRSLVQGLVQGPPVGGDGLMEPDVVQRKVKAALNKMTPEKFDKIAEQILEIAAQSKHESDGRTLRQVIQLTFEKATDEAHWAPMYAAFCRRMLESMSPDIKDENIKDKNGHVVTGGNLFRKYLLNRCQEEFERGWKVNLPRKEGETEEAAMMSDEYYVAAAAKRRGLGLVKFIGELFKLSMLTERIMHECVKKLLDYEGTPDEAEVESLTSLLRTIGKQLDSSESKAQGRMDLYFERINQIIANPELPSRLKFMLMDIVDLRRKGWVSKEDDKGPKTIQEIHAEAERKHREDELRRLASQTGRGSRGGHLPMGRGDARSFSGYGQIPPPDTSNRVGTDDLRRLGARSARNPSSTGPASLGPPSLLGGRTNSGRRGLGPGGLLARGDDSNSSSRTGTPPAGKEKEKKDESSINAFR